MRTIKAEIRNPVYHHHGCRQSERYGFAMLSPKVNMPRKNKNGYRSMQSRPMLYVATCVGAAASLKGTPSFNRARDGAQCFPGTHNRAVRPLGESSVGLDPQTPGEQGIFVDFATQFGPSGADFAVISMRCLPIPAISHRENSLSKFKVLRANSVRGAKVVALV